MPVHVNALCYGDCLDWMERWDDESVDLIYLDPPFNSSATYNVLYAQDSAGGAQTRVFADTWTWDAAAGERLAMYEGAAGRPAHRAIVGLASILGPSGMLAYITYMTERLEHMHRLLKPSGSLYYHCDPTASHYLKVVLDSVFGSASFMNEISWRRTTTRVTIGRAHSTGHGCETCCFTTLDRKVPRTGVFISRSRHTTRSTSTATTRRSSRKPGENTGLTT